LNPLTTDTQILAKLNHQLIQGEGHRNAMALDELAVRMRGWLEGDYEAVVFEYQADVIGYALFVTEENHLYLRQFFVATQYRKREIGRHAVYWLWQNAWQAARRVRIDVLCGNKTAQGFWRAVGFQDYCLTMEADAPE